MRIKIVQRPRIADADGIRLDVFEVGFQYDVGNRIGALLLAEGWAVPVRADEPGVVIPLGRENPGRAEPRNVVRLRDGDQQERVPSTAEKPRTVRKNHDDA